MRLTQEQMFYQAHRKISDVNIAFMEMVKAGDITRRDLVKLISKRPGLYSRFSAFLVTLPE